MPMSQHQEMPDQQIITLFNKTFYKGFNTQLIGGGKEPEYIPADKHVTYHRIIYRQDYIASALHEIAHWCIAGVRRRQQHDYGYWYIPDGRNVQEQAEFEWVESKSQALEWIFSKASKRQFTISVDNLDNAQSTSNGPSLNFKQNIVECALHYCQGGLNTRASMWSRALFSRYSDIDCGDNNSGDNDPELLNYLDITHYYLEALR
jgi:elongation factor P hydroxylase